MTLSPEIRELVRQRAKYACEYCGVTETDSGGRLTIDHFQPQAKGGSDSPDNLLYCCARCNQYKLDYWPGNSDNPGLWNPRSESTTVHFLELDDGSLHSLTPTGAFTLKRLRLNRPPLVAYRLRQRQQAEEARLLAQYRDLVQLLGQVNNQLSTLIEAQRGLLEEQRELLQLLFDRRE